MSISVTFKVKLKTGQNMFGRLRY